jgi:hypothetical protein
MEQSSNFLDYYKTMLLHGSPVLFDNETGTDENTAEP